MATATKITVRLRSVDGFGETRRFATLDGARRFAHRGAGEHPEIGSNYAISGDGIVRVRVEGCTLAELFPPRK